MTDTISNNDVADLGRKSVELWKQGDKGDAVATFCLWVAHNTVTFQTTIKDAKGHSIETISFDIAEMNRHSVNYRDIKNKNGSRNIKYVAARTLEVASRIFGLENPTAAQKQRIDRALELVAGFERQSLELEAITLSRRNELVVPYVLMNAEPNPDKATTNEINAYERMRDSETALDGKEGNSLANLKRRLSPPKDRGAQDDRADKGVAFMASVLMLNGILEARNDVEGDNPAADSIPAFAGTVKAKLWDLYQQLGTYFESDPVDDKQEVPFEEKKAA